MSISIYEKVSPFSNLARLTTQIAGLDELEIQGLGMRTILKDVRAGRVSVMVM
jgi:hypothetical protein